jgi:hypothetical protein
MNSSQESNLVNDPKFENILNELKAREPIFHHPEFGTSRTDFENMIVPDFWEVGASGNRYSKDCVLDELEKRYSGEYKDEWETTDFHIRQLSIDTYLLTYTLFQGKRETRRATIWKQTDLGWKIVYHQGTVVSE